MISTHGGVSGFGSQRFRGSVTNDLLDDGKRRQCCGTVAYVPETGGTAGMNYAPEIFPQSCLNSGLLGDAA